MTIGPSNSGKSFLMKNNLIPFLENKNIKHKYLSTDEIRKSLLMEDLHKHDNKMQTVNKQTFDLFHKEIDLFSSYPVNIPVIITDATNLSKESRNDIINIANKNGYNILGLVFDYSDLNDYTKYIDDKIDKKEIFYQVKKFRQETIKDINKKEFDSIHYIKSNNDFDKIHFSYQENNSGRFINFENICVVGDLHGCYYEFLELLHDNKGIEFIDDGTDIPKLKINQQAYDNNEYIHHILIGDLVDKGPEVEKLIRFIHKNWVFFTLIQGNHDTHNYKYLKGEIKDSIEENNLINKYFDSIKLFKSNEELKNIFFELYEMMFTSVYNDKFFINHAPCRNKYIGKLSNKALKHQQSFIHPSRKSFNTEEEFMDEREKTFQFILDDADKNYPFHIVGHVTVPEVFRYKNKFLIDTGCYAGNYLSSLTFIKDNYNPFVRKYKSKQIKNNEIPNLFRLKVNEINFNALDISLQKRIKFLEKNKINFISGTMCPANKDFDKNIIESLYKGIEYYRNNNVKQYILQPKSMGSRMQCLLHETDINKCRSFSRNAFEINQDRLNTEDKLEDIYKYLQEKLMPLFKRGNLEYILLDGELMPWNAMANNMIENQFNINYKAGISENKILEDTGFEKLIEQFNDKINNLSDYQLNDHTKKLNKIYTNFKDELFLDIEESNKCLNKYKHQVDLFSNKNKLEFKPFAILKTIGYDGTEENWIGNEHTNLLMYSILSKEPYCFISEEEGNERYLISIDQVIYEAKTADEAILTFWDYITEQKEMEGIVIKPNQTYISGIAPYLKVRNKEYLRLVYGNDYLELSVKNQRLLDKKSIKRKLETSIKEYELSRQLLDIPMKEISINNKKWLNLIVALINENESEKQLDPRL